MTTPQQPIGSGFGFRSTTNDVLSGISLTGKTAVVTGGYSGLGLETTQALSAAGAQVIVPARRPDVARAELAAVPGVRVEPMDLADLDSIYRLADALLAIGRSIDFLIGAGGVMASPETRVGPGWEGQFAINHLGHFALTNELWPALVAGRARVISYSSAGHHLSGIRWDDVQFDTGYDKWLAYGQSKTANVLFAVELDRRAQADGVRAFALHPGAILTPLGRHLQPEDMDALLTYGSDGKPLMPEFKSPEAGAATPVWAATSPQLDGLGGLYLEDCDVAPVADPDGRVTGQALGVFPHAIDPEKAARLWTWSAEQTGLH